MDRSTAVVRAALNSTSYASGKLAGKGAFNLFRMPKGRSRPRPDEAPVFDTARRGELQFNDSTVVTYEWGDGARKVLVVHGWESRASRFAKIIGELVELGYSPVSFDAPGHGDSTGRTTNIAEYLKIITRLHREHGDFEAVVAHSLGVTATFLSMQHGLRVGRIAAISPVPEFAYLVDKFCEQLGLRDKLKDELRGRIEREMFPDEENIWHRFSVFAGADEVSVPILVIHDDDDDMVDPPHARRVLAAFGDHARLVTTERLGHRRIIGAPRVVREVVDFVSVGAGRQGNDLATEAAQ
ncbi:alpha/beta hydrolase [Streptomyces sp. NPDC090082]|uniref:alpha/beta hydrolase n=2 Tax=unclassified Streptomyces TaxID=2593676 RepID=UPI002E79F867|nr:alpha/beta hydrolase [Streptomyces sp. SP18ES09]MEE1816872.1 alpha/beta hydrolase [Streptomyces sp. SP18ES09]